MIYEHVMFDSIDLSTGVKTTHTATVTNLAKALNPEQTRFDVLGLAAMLDELSPKRAPINFAAQLTK